MNARCRRLRWQCRRALLELDLVLERFLEQDFDQLDSTDLEHFERLLALDDHDLWQLLNGALPNPDPSTEKIIRRLRATGHTTT